LCTRNDRFVSYEEDASWVTLSLSPVTFYTDTLPHLDRVTNEKNTSSTYRIRAENAEGWGHYCKPFEVDLTDKLCKSPTKHTAIRGDTYVKQRRLLPHGITIKSNTTTNTSNNNTTGTEAESINTTAMKILSPEEVKEIIQSNMLCAPAPRTDVEDMSDEEAAQMEIDSSPHSRTAVKYPHVSNSNSNRNIDHISTNMSASLPNQSSVMSASSRVSRVSGGSSSSGNASVGSDADRLKSVQMDTHSALAGNSLDNVSVDLQSWLTRLADACPLEDEDMWQTRKRLEASDSLSSTKLLQMDSDYNDDDDNDDKYDDDDDAMNSNRYVEKQTEEKINSPKHNQNNSFMASKEPPIMSTVYNQSEKNLRNMTDYGAASELDNVIQRLASVHKKIPSKTRHSTEKFKFTISPLPSISNKTI
jgi:hypothetical protein